MADLKKLLVHVPSSACDGFKATYVTGEGRSTAYDNKIVFLEKTQEIFTKGKLYGANISDFNALKELVGTIPAGATSTNVVDYIAEKAGALIEAADHVHSVSEASGETLIDVVTSGKDVTVGSTSALTTAVANANSAIQSLSIAGHDLSKTAGEITVDQLKSDLSLGGAAYKAEDYYEVAGVAKGLVDGLKGELGTAAYVTVDSLNATAQTKAETEAGKVLGTALDDKGVVTVYGVKAYAADVAATAEANATAKINTVSQGAGITVTPTTVGEHTNYEISISGTIFHFKGEVESFDKLPESPANGDVYSVGGKTLYAWDGDEWINIGSPEGVTGVDTTSSAGVALAQNANGTVKVNVIPGSVADGNGSVVTGGAVYSAISALSTVYEPIGEAAKLIGELAGSADSTGGSYVSVNVTTKNGEVSSVTVNDSALADTVSAAASALQSVTVLGTTLTKNSSTLSVDDAKAALGLGGAAYKAENYYEVAGTAQGLIDGLNLGDIITHNASEFEAAGTAQGLINNLAGSVTSTTGSYVNVTVSTSKGEVSAVSISETDALTSAIAKANSALQSISANGDTYVSASVAPGTSTVAVATDINAIEAFVVDNLWEEYAQA